jgi:hypothetical protein
MRYGAEKSMRTPVETQKETQEQYIKKLTALLLYKQAA